MNKKRNKSKLRLYIKKQRVRLKHYWNQRLLNHYDFSIISNNCWGTRTYQKYGLPYRSPFQSLFIFAPDYISLITDFSLEKLVLTHFINKNDSKYKDELVRQGLYEKDYPIGVLIDGTELHFLHYESKNYAQEKWDARVKRINPEKLIFKFSDGDLCTTQHIEAFDRLPYKNKICFSSKPFPELKSVVFMRQFKNEDRVTLEWKHDKKYINLHKFINKIT